LQHNAEGEMRGERNSLVRNVGGEGRRKEGEYLNQPLGCSTTQRAK